MKQINIRAIFKRLFSSTAVFFKKKNNKTLSLPLPVDSKKVKKPVGDKQSQQHSCPNYTKLKAHFRDVGRLAAIAETLGRDFLTAMPEGATKSRLGQITYLHRRLQEDIRHKDMPELITNAKTHQGECPDDWDEWDKGNLREMEFLYREHACIDPELMEQRARLSYDGRRVHRDCLRTNDWETAAKFLEKTVQLGRSIGEKRCPAMGNNNPYQSLMQEYMHDITIDDVDKWFGSLETKMQPLMSEIVAAQKLETPAIPLTDSYHPKAQMWLNRSLLHALGFDFQRGDLYETGHNPVEGGTPEDTRLVIKHVEEANFLVSLKSALHEGGHGLYIQGLPRDVWRYQPVGQDMGAAVHESQAILVEMFIGRSLPFFEFLTPRLEGLFHCFHEPSLSPQNLYKLKTRVVPQLDRKKADEVTYFFHVMIRYTLEQQLINGSLAVKDIPDAWAALTEKYFNMTPQKPSEGCLQDVHWFVGKFGYFPSYIIGQMIAAQLYQSLSKNIDDLEGKIRLGHFSEVKAWLNSNIHDFGRLYDSKTLIRNATNDNISEAALIKHFRKRYLAK